MDEARASEAERIVNCYHFSKESNRSHGIPFKFVLKPVRFLFSLVANKNSPKSNFCFSIE